MLRTTSFRWVLLGVVLAALTACGSGAEAPAPIDVSYRLTRDQALALSLEAGRAFRGEGQPRAARGVADALLWLQLQIGTFFYETDRGPGPSFDVALTSQDRNATLRAAYQDASGGQHRAELELTSADAATLAALLARVTQ